MLGFISALQNAYLLIRMWAQKVVYGEKGLS